ncbi:MAG: BolA/IbaG family iron-sulfur metabolism protein [Candidatus Eremiobacteraeota bacterium]|nr:BolA/IbaG family iron-sulfur metabolism protein [Candidatus Eremiobacteraeota bacterium]
MIDNESLRHLILHAIPDARVEIFDRTGTMDHFNISVTSAQFAQKSLIEQHQMVYAALRTALKDGRVHAVELKTQTLERSAS